MYSLMTHQIYADNTRDTDQTICTAWDNVNAYEYIGNDTDEEYIGIEIIPLEP